MTKLKYRLQWTGSGGPAAIGPGITSAYIAGATGTPQTRIYQVADSPPAFAGYPLTKGYGGPAILDGDYYVDYKDTAVASKRLARLSLIDYAGSCFSGGTYVNPTYQVIRYETYIEINALVSAGSGTVEASIDGGTTWKTLINSGGVGNVCQFTNTEITSAGFTDTIPSIKVHRIYLSDILNVTSFVNVTPGPGPSFVKINVTGSTAGYVIGNVVKFQNSSLYNSQSGTVTEVNALYLVLQMAFNGDQAGAKAGKPALCTATIAQDFFIGDIVITPYTASISVTNETSNTADDGTITIVMTGGSGVFTFDWTDGSTSQNRTGLQAGTYSVHITDTITGQEEVDDIVITEPAAPPIPNGTYFDIPKMQSLRFVREAVIDNCNTFQNFDNTLFCKMVFDGVKIRTPFYQKVCRCDVLTIQAQSNFPSHTVELLSQVDGSVVKTYNNMTLKQQLTGVVTSYDIYLSAGSVLDPDNTTRVIFNSGTIPIVVNIGDVFDIINNVDGFNGTYEIVGVSTDILLGAPYLLINLLYSAGTPTSAGRAVFTDNVLNFNIFETILAFNDVVAGLYYMRIRGVNIDATFTEMISEPIDLKSIHPFTNFVEFRNFDNDADVVYTTGITHKMRLESKLQKPIPGRQDENYRESNGSPVKLTSRPQRKYKLDYFNQPFYRLELLDVLFGFDQVIINKVEYFCEEGTSEPANRDFFLLANGNATIEQKQWFAQYNGDDLGGVDPGYIITQLGYIQRT